jgi:hypothetical protein
VLQELKMTKDRYNYLASDHKDISAERVELMSELDSLSFALQSAKQVVIV